MRPIEFRIWDIDNKIMYDGDGESSTNDGDCCIHSFWNFYLPRDQHHLNGEVMQFTGLLDCHGKKIFDGDILEIDDQYMKLADFERKHVLVGFHDGAFMLGRNKDPHYMNTYLYMGIFGQPSKAATVIGNIFENPELL